jgi:uncharacterized protein YbgA (DUF1722 family)
VATAGQYKPTDLAKQYGGLFMNALKVKVTVKKHVNVLQHSAGHLKKYLSGVERTELQESITDYQRQCIPMTVPLTLIKHYAHTRAVPYLTDQVYLNPHPQELILRNHV